MTVKEKLLSVLEAFELPVAEDFYDGEAGEYLTYQCEEDAARVYGDNDPVCTVTKVKIHHFLPVAQEYGEKRKRIRNALAQAEFTYPKVTVSVEKENTVRHILFECEIENEYEIH